MPVIMAAIKTATVLIVVTITIAAINDGDGPKKLVQFLCFVIKMDT